MLFEDSKLTTLEKTQKHAQHRASSDADLYRTFEKCEEFYEGNQHKYIDRTGAETDNEYNERPKLFVNFTQPIADKRASVYDNTPSRTITDISDDEQEMLEYIWQGCNATFQEIDLQTELTSFSCVRIRWDEDYEYMEYIPYSARNSFPLVSDEDGEVIGVCLWWKREYMDDEGNVEAKDYFQIWDDTYVQEFLGNELIKTEENPSGGPVEHNMGCLPFVFFFAKERNRDYYQLPPIVNVVEQNYQINNLMSDLRFICHYQSFGQLVLTDPDIDQRGNVVTEGIKVGPRKILTIPKDGRAEFINPNAAIADLMNVIDFVIDKLYTTSCVPKVTLAPNPTQASGVSLLIQWYPLIGYLNHKRSSFRGSEQELVEKTLQIYKKIKTGTFPEEIEYSFTLNYDEETVPNEVADQIAEDEFELNLGLSSVADLMMRKDPDLTEEEAIKQIMENAAINKKLQTMKVSLSPEEQAAIDAEIERKMNGMSGEMMEDEEEEEEEEPEEGEQE